MPAAYLIAEIEITHPEGYAEYTKAVPATVEKYGGKFLVRGGKSQPLEGEWPERRRVIIEFASMERAKAWWDSSEYAKPKAMRRANSKGRLIFLEGV
jgi:uncharacterized protein (DUF1330 family)